MINALEQSQRGSSRRWGDRVRPAPWGGGAYLALIGLWLLAGCSARHYQKSADREAYRLIAQKSQMVTNMDLQFTIEQTNRPSLEGLPVATNTEAFLGAAAEEERNAALLSLDQALAIAVQHSRIYQNNKEQLYLSALGLSLARHDFTPLFSGSADVGATGTREHVRQKVDQVVGGTNAVVSDSVVENLEARGGGGLKVDWLIRDLGRLSADLTADFTRFFTEGPQSLAQSSLTARFTRPLLRNAGYRSDLENLTQAERDLLYRIRDFTRFRKEFSVDVATAYYGVLSARDQARNVYLNLLGSRRAAERTRALAEEGRATQAGLGRLEQQELSAESSWINAVRIYRRAVDDFKIRLGIPVDSKVVLDDRELAQLTIRHPDLQVEDCIRVALAARLDYQNQQDALEDAARKVELAADALKPQVDLTADVTLGANYLDGEGSAYNRSRSTRWNAGLVVDPGLNRKAERNSYRAAQIARERSSRALEQLRDEIELEVRESWRSLERAKRSYELSEIGVKLAERRVEEQDLLAEVGRAQAQDQVDAQNNLAEFRNQRTQDLVAHTIARLQFWKNMGILYVKDNGRWEEVDHAKAE